MIADSPYIFKLQIYFDRPVDFRYFFNLKVAVFPTLSLNRVLVKEEISLSVIFWGISSKRRLPVINLLKFFRFPATQLQHLLSDSIEKYYTSKNQLQLLQRNILHRHNFWISLLLIIKSHNRQSHRT